MNIKIRKANISDVPKILYFIREVGKSEGDVSLVKASEASLKRWVFEKEIAHVIFAIDGDDNDKEIGFAIYYNNFSAFKGKAGIYLEDMYVEPSYRDKNIEKTLMDALRAECKEQGLGRFEWWCNDKLKDKIDFYLEYGAKPMNDYTIYRIDEMEI